MAIKYRPKYIKCPRCELNYIDANKQEYCDVCLKELKGKHDDFDDFDNENEEQMELCPVCGENMMEAGEEMCSECKKKRQIETEEEPDPEQDDEWRNYLDEEIEDVSVPEGLPPEDFGEDFEDEEEEEEEEESQEEEAEDPLDDEEDFDFKIDDAYDYDDEDDEDEDDEDDDFDDDDFDAGVKKANRTAVKKERSKEDR